MSAKQEIRHEVGELFAELVGYIDEEHSVDAFKVGQRAKAVADRISRALVDRPDDPLAIAAIQNAVRTHTGLAALHELEGELALRDEALDAAAALRELLTPDEGGGDGLK